VFAILSGQVLLYESWDWLLFTLGWFLFVHLIVILYEERHLQRKFGESYVRYAKNVGRWIPGRRYV